MPSCIALHGIGTSQLEVSECADGITNDDSAVIKNFLKFSRGFDALVRRQIGLATHINRIQATEKRIEVDCWYCQFIWNSDLQQLDGLLRLMCFSATMRETLAGN